MTRPVRLTLAPVLEDGINGAWWPHSASLARELPGLIEALRDSLGEVVDIAVNWSAIDGVPDLDSLTRRGATTIPGLKERRQRVITLTGKQAIVNLLVVPSRTTRPLATIVMRHAAAMPINIGHLDTPAYHAAESIVRAAHAECAHREPPSTPPPTTG